jgi:uncharacterized membrane protein
MNAHQEQTPLLLVIPPAPVCSHAHIFRVAYTEVVAAVFEIDAWANISSCWRRFPRYNAISSAQNAVFWVFAWKTEMLLKLHTACKIRNKQASAKGALLERIPAGESFV